MLAAFEAACCAATEFPCAIRENQATRNFPRQNVAGHVGDGHDGVVERSLHVHESVRNVLALFLLEGFLLAFFLGRRGAACCYGFAIFKSSQFSVVSSQ